MSSHWNEKEPCLITAHLASFPKSFATRLRIFAATHHEPRMSLGALLGGADCGPSNPLQSLLKLDQDRGQHGQTVRIAPAVMCPERHVK